MNRKLVLNASLVRKESEFRTKSCVVEKAIAVSHGEFEYLKNHPLRDNDLIAESADLMYCDSDDIYHCLLIYDEENGDGLLIESEGTAYARYAQYIPRANELVEKHRNSEISLTNGEKKICGLLSKMADRIANAVCHGYNDFTIDDVLKDLGCNFDEVKKMLVESAAEILNERNDIKSVKINDLDIPFQPELTIITKEETEDMIADIEESMDISCLSL